MTRRLLGTALKLAIALVSVPLYTRLIGMSQWGLLMLFQAAAAPMVLLDLGVGAAAIKRVSEALGRGEPESAARTARAALLFNAAVLAVGAALLLVLSEWFARSVFAIPQADVPRAIVGFRLVAVSWAAGAALTFFSNLLVAHQRYDEVLRTTSFAAAITAVAGLTAAALTRDVVWTLVGQALGATLAATFALRRATGVLPTLLRRPRWDGDETRKLLQFGVWQTTANVGGVLASWGDRYILGVFFPPRTVGFYALAQLLQQQLSSIFHEGGDVLFPAVSHRQGMGDIASARRIVLLAGWLLTTVFGPAAIALGVLGGDFLGLWISREAASEATPVLRLLCAAAIAGLPALAPMTFAIGTGRNYWQAPSSAVVGIASIATSLALVPTMGLSGVGIGLLAGALARWGLVYVLWRSLFREEVPGLEFGLSVFAPPVVSLALLAAFVPLHDSVSHSPGWALLLAEGTITLAAAALAQLAVGEVLPGGRARRMNVIASFRPIADQALGLFRRADKR